MAKLFATWCTVVVATFGFANYKGYVLTSLLSGAQSADKSVNRYHK